MTTTAERLDALRERMALAARRAGRDPGEVRLVAVAKTAAPEALREAWAAGQRRFAHNRVQRLEEDRRILPEAEWHLIGPIQGNKIRRALRCADWIQTVGEERTARRLQRILEEGGRPPAPVLVQVNLHPEDGRYGCPPAHLPVLLETLRRATPLLDPRGLMTLAPLGAPEAEVHRVFAGLRSLAREGAERGLLPARPELSMGMSEDFEIAVAEGATLVRVGRALFPG